MKRCSFIGFSATAVFRASVVMLAALSLSVGVAGAAQGGTKHLLPPGSSAVSEYSEDVPSDMGSAAPGSGSQPASTLTPSERRRLEHLGAKGKLLLNVVNETAPQTVPAAAGSSSAGRTSASASPSRKRRRAQPGGSQDRPVVAASFSNAAPDSSASAILGAATGQGGGGGMGILLPALMAAGLLIVVFSLVRRRGARRL